MPKSQKPTETKGERFSSTITEREHPAFGMIVANRVQGSATLHGSSIQHSGFIEIEIVQAKEEVRNGTTWHFGGEIITTVLLSEAQWAGFVSNMNVGSGVPCTLKLIRSGDELVRLPEIEDESYEAKRAKEIRDAVEQDAEQYRRAVARLDELLKQPSIKKAELAALRAMFLHPVDYAGLNAAHAAELLTEHSEELVKDAKAEIEAYVSRMAFQFPGLSQSKPLELDSNQVKTLELRHDD